MTKLPPIFLFNCTEPLHLALEEFDYFTKNVLVNLPKGLSTHDESFKRITKLSELEKISGITIIINPTSIINGPQVFSEIMYSLIYYEYSPLFMLCTAEDIQLLTSALKDVPYTQIFTKITTPPVYLPKTPFYFFHSSKLPIFEFSLVNPNLGKFVKVLPTTRKELLFLQSRRVYQSNLFIWNLRSIACSILFLMKYHLYRTWRDLPDDRWNSHSQNALSRKTLDRKSFTPKWKNVVRSFFWWTWRRQKQKAKSFRIRKPNFGTFFSGKKLSKLS